MQFDKNFFVSSEFIKIFESIFATKTFFELKIFENIFIQPAKFIIPNCFNPNQCVGGLLEPPPPVGIGLPFLRGLR